MPAPNIVWSWRSALFGLILALPGAILILSGRVMPGIAVLVGAFCASLLLAIGAPVWVIAIVAPAAIVGLAATHTSRWYLNAGFTTFLVFWMLLYQQTGSGQIAHRFFERILETLAGVAIAYFFGLLIPSVLEGRVQRYVAWLPSAMTRQS